MNQQEIKNNSGFSLIEALISMAIVGYVVVAILAGVSQQQKSTQDTSERNLAILMAERRLEELLKFTSAQLQPLTLVNGGTSVDYIVLRGTGYEIHEEKAGNPVPNELRQFRRTTVISLDDLMKQIATIRVLVEFGARKRSVVGGGTLIYPHRIELTTRRSLK